MVLFVKDMEGLAVVLPYNQRQLSFSYLISMSSYLLNSSETFNSNEGELSKALFPLPAIMG